MSSNIEKLLSFKSAKRNIVYQLDILKDYLKDLECDCLEKKYFYNYQLQCLLQDSLQKYNKTDNLVSSPTKDFPELIVKSKEISGKNVHGVVSIVTIKLKDNYYDMVLKYGKHEDKDLETVLHEVSVGFVLNHLRSTGNINFMYVYNAFYCSVGKKICSTSKDTTTCAFFELVKGKSIAALIKERFIFDHFNHFLELFLQIVLALCDAQVYCKFIHYDLHDENILISKLDKPETITYQYAGYKLNDVKYIATIIDYGNSIVQSFIDKKLYLHAFLESKVKVKHFEDVAFTKDPYVGCYDVFYLSMMILSTMADNVKTEQDKKELQHLWKICMSFFIKRYNTIGCKITQECKTYFYKQSFTSDSLYYRPQVNDKELFNVDIKEYLQYIIDLLKPTNLKRN